MGLLLKYTWYTMMYGLMYSPNAHNRVVASTSRLLPQQPPDCRILLFSCTYPSYLNSKLVHNDAET